MHIWTPEATEPWTWQGRIEVVTRHLDGHVEVEEFPNLITDSGRKLLRDGLLGVATDTKIKYVALGTSSTAPAVTQTALGAEAFRKLATATAHVDTSGSISASTIFYISPGEAVSTVIAELGFFAGPSASGTTGSGIMVARVLYSHTKTNIESLQITRTDAF